MAIRRQDLGKILDNLEVNLEFVEISLDGPAKNHENIQSKCTKKVNNVGMDLNVAQR